MKCPYRKTIVHHKEEHAGYTITYAYDEEIFADCYESECPFYRSYDEPKDKCLRADIEIKKND